MLLMQVQFPDMVLQKTLNNKGRGGLNTTYGILAWGGQTDQLYVAGKHFRNVMQHNSIENVAFTTHFVLGHTALKCFNTLSCCDENFYSVKITTLKAL